MKVATFDSADHVLEEVRAMRVRGGSAFGQATATAFRFVAQDETLDSREALFQKLDETADALLREKPTMATIHNARALIVERTKVRPSLIGLEALREEVESRANLFLDHSAQSVEALGHIGGNLVQDGQTIMMHSFSESVMAVFAGARVAGKTFSVICTESRPLRESRFSAARLSALGVPVTYVLDAAMAEMVPQADWVLVGADSLRVDGAVANKMGTNLLSILAAHFDKPFYAATETLKLQPKTKEGHPIVLEQRAASEIAPMSDFEHSEQIQIRNQFFDLTPPSRIAMLITEQGMYAPAQIGQAWRELESKFE